MTKTKLEDLAIFGGAVAFTEKLHVGRPNIGDRERLMERIEKILDTRWLSNDGPFVTELEKRIADFVGVKHCIGMCNATVALEIAIRALGMSGEVIVPAFTFVATAHALQWQEITPVFCDADPQTHLIDPHKVERMITPRTSGIIGVHLWGQACDVGALAEIALRHNLKILYDAAHAFGCSHKGRMIGNFGNAEVFSFHATKFFNSFEGGAVVTNDDELAKKIRLMKNFGFGGYDKVIYIGTNGKMPEVSAAMGLTSLESMDDFIAVNRNNYEQYMEHLRDVPGVRLLIYDATEKMNYQYIVLEIDESVTKVTRDELVQLLWAENVFARRYFFPGCHRMEPYRSYYPHAGLMLPVTEQLAERVMTLPTGTAVGAQQISSICQIIQTAISQGEEVHRRLSERASDFAPGATLDARTVR
ncbi:MAG TPA: aminotransferase class I/II-fold pyridoxal phosphate-dependent enzyme [Pyrinomonadaceae bacterium]|jgi:dTDP-4-amino-4,6-dideoxygalactose transaminase